MRKAHVLLASSCAVLASFVVGCGGGSHASFFTGDGGGATGDGGAAGDAPVFGTKDSAPSLGPGSGCSPDLQNVVDHNGNIVEMCPPNEGCASGKCIAACMAAAASKGNVGCDFVLSTPPFDDELLPPCFAAFIANNWDKDVTITVAYNGANYDVTTFGRIPDGTPAAANWATVPATGLPVGKVAVLFLSSDPNSTHPIGGPMKCPVPDAVKMSTAVASGATYDTGIGHTFHISTDVPVSLYDIMPYGGARSFLPSAQLVLPTSAWGTNYLAVTPKHTSGGPTWLQVVAQADNTAVQVVPTAALPSGNGVASAAQNSVTTYMLNAGQFLQWEAPAFTGTPEELSGTILSSNKPISVPAGSSSLCLKDMTSRGGGCDSAHQLMPPVSALGFKYVGIPFATRRADLMAESIPYRLVGAASGTTLAYDPPITGAPTALAVGELADFETTTPFTVTSQDANHAFYATQMMPGCNVTSGARPGITPGIDTQLGLPACLGDEEFVIVLPPAQWLSKYVFFTDPTYGTTNLAVAREKTAAGFEDVTVDCVGPVTGWQPVGSSGQYEVATVDLIRGTMSVGTCTSGGHVAESSGPFGLIVWGTDEYASYAYPAGGNVAPINTVVVPPIPQ